MIGLITDGSYSVLRTKKQFEITVADWLLMWRNVILFHECKPFDFCILVFSPLFWSGGIKKLALCRTFGFLDLMDWSELYTLTSSHRR
jgi:hypothetical protein